MFRLAGFAATAFGMKLGPYDRYDPSVQFKTDVHMKVDNGVIVMTKDNFNDVVDNYSPILIHFFYNDW